MNYLVLKMKLNNSGNRWENLEKILYWLCGIEFPSKLAKNFEQKKVKK